MFWLVGVTAFLCGMLVAAIRSSGVRSDVYSSRVALLRRMDRLLRARVIPYDKGLDLPELCIEVIPRDGTVGAIKFLRQSQGLSLKQAQDTVHDALEKGFNMKVELIVEQAERNWIKQGS